MVVGGARGIVGGAQYLEGRYASREGWMVVGGARGIVGG